jgi:hypothetical protein
MRLKYQYCDIAFATEFPRVNVYAKGYLKIALMLSVCTTPANAPC